MANHPYQYRMLRRLVLGDFNKKIITNWPPTITYYDRQNENQFLPPAVNNRGHANTARTTGSLYSSRKSALAIAGERIGLRVESLRRYTTGGDDSKVIRPPIRVPGIAGIYAMSLYSAAHRNNVLEVVEKDLVLVRDTFEKDKVFRDFMMAPDINIPLKLDGLMGIHKLGIHDLTYNMLVTLVENRRINMLTAVINGYMEIMAAHRGIIECEIVTAQPLNAQQKTKLAEIFTKFLQGKLPRTKERVDPKLIGGFIVHVGHLHIDMSIKRLFNEYADLIRRPI